MTLTLSCPHVPYGMPLFFSFLFSPTSHLPNAVQISFSLFLELVSLLFSVLFIVGATAAAVGVGARVRSFVCLAKSCVLLRSIFSVSCLFAIIG